MCLVNVRYVLARHAWPQRSRCVDAPGTLRERCGYAACHVEPTSSIRVCRFTSHVSSHCPLSCVTTCPRQIISVSQSAKSRESFPKCNSFSITLYLPVYVCTSVSSRTHDGRVVSLSQTCLLLRDTLIRNNFIIVTFEL